MKFYVREGERKIVKLSMFVGLGGIFFPPLPFVVFIRSMMLSHFTSTAWMIIQRGFIGFTEDLQRNQSLLCVNFLARLLLFYQSELVKVPLEQVLGV